MPNFLLVGNGAREHIIAEKVSQSAKVFACTQFDHPGISRVCEKSGGASKVCNILDGAVVAEFAVEQDINIAFASSDEVLYSGVTDALLKKGIACACPTKKAARIEWDKAYCRNLLQKRWVQEIPQYGVFEDAGEAAAFIEKLGDVAVKPVGLTAGKGVRVSGAQLKNVGEAAAYAQELIEKDGKVVVEEKLVGEEFTLQCFTDGKKLVAMPLVQDFKAAFENDAGPNTGGMGSYSCVDHLLPFVSEQEKEKALEVMQTTVNALQEDGSIFCGVIYGQFMLTEQGIKLVEFNARFGDPEALNVLSIIEDDLFSVFQTIAQGELAEKVGFKHLATGCKYLVPAGYPNAPAINQPITIAASMPEGTNYYYASVREENGVVMTTSSRAIAVTAASDSLQQAEKTVEEATSCFKENLFHRADIATTATIERKILRMREIMK